jgi:hypothetical protein
VHAFSTFNINKLKEMFRILMATYIPLINGVIISIGQIFVFVCFEVFVAGRIVKSRIAKNDLRKI